MQNILRVKKEASSSIPGCSNGIYHCYKIDVLRHFSPSAMTPTACRYSSPALEINPGTHGAQKITMMLMPALSQKGS